MVVSHLHLNYAIARGMITELAIYLHNKNTVYMNELLLSDHQFSIRQVLHVLVHYTDVNTISSCKNLSDLL